MSTILKALRRLEDEKQATADRPLREAVAAAPGEPLPRRRGRALGLALGFGALLALLGGALLLDLPGRWQRAAAAPQVAAGPPAPTPEAVAAATQTPAPIPVPPEAASAPAALAAPVADTPPADAAAPPEAAAQARSAPPQTPAAPAAEVPLPARAAVEEPRATAAPASPRRATPPRVAKAPQPAAEPEVEPVVVAPSLPSVVVTGTVWHPEPARRTASVALEGRDAPLELRQGDAVGSLVVREIEPGGVLFQLGDIELRRAVGEQP